MALGSEIAVERGSVKWEVGPTKDAIQAFMELLVDPKLPYQCSINDTPSEDDQKSMARQMHAVVLLYNYYHRKQKPELEFLDYVSFCKLALSLRPKLTSFMKMIHGSNAVGSNGAEDQLSVTEKAIKIACDVAMSLDALKDVPNIEGYPISKVAVLLIDSENENCLLQRDVVTEGVWSLIEKDVSPSKKRKTKDQHVLTDHSKFLQIAFDAVKDITGIDVSDLVVLEAHVVYSLSKPNSATQLYMVKCNQSIDVSQRFSFEYLLESLQGPLAEKFMDDWVPRTSVIEHYCLFPYLGFISSWLPRKDSCVPILSDYIAQCTNTKDADEISPSRILASSLAEYSDADLNYIGYNKSEKKTKTSSSDHVADEGGKDLQKERKHSSCGKNASSVDIFRSTEAQGHVTDDPKTGHDTLKSGKSTTRVSCDNIDNDGGTPGKASPSGRSMGHSLSVVRDDSSSQRTNTGTVSKIPLIKEMKRKMDLNMKSKKNSFSQHDANHTEVGVNSKEEENALAFEVPYKIQVENAVPSEVLQNALALLERKRQELYSQLSTMEDTLASYELIIDRVRDGGEVGLARQCIESSLSGSDPLLLLKNEVQVQGKAHQAGEHTSTPQPDKQTKYSNIFLPGKSSCQDLEYTCLKNNWKLPRYFSQPLDGKFYSSVVVHCTGSTLSSKGGLESKPLEARESAAAQMIAKIRALALALEAAN